MILLEMGYAVSAAYRKQIKTQSIRIGFLFGDFQPVS